MSTANSRGSAQDASVATRRSDSMDMSYAEAQGLAVTRLDADRAIVAARRGVEKAEAAVKAAKEALAQATADRKELG